MEGPTINVSDHVDWGAGVHLRKGQTEPSIWCSLLSDHGYDGAYHLMLLPALPAPRTETSSS